MSASSIDAAFSDLAQLDIVRGLHLLFYQSISVLARPDLYKTMPRKKVSIAEPPTAEASTEVQELTITQLVPEAKATKRVTSQNLEAIQRKALYAHAEPMLHEAFEVLRIKLRAGDKDALRLALELNKMIGAKNGVSVTTNVQQNNANEAKAVAALSAKGFDDLVRRLDGRDHQESTNADFVSTSD